MRRLLSYITLLIMMATSVVTGQWNEWGRRPDWSHLMRHLVPQDNLALFVNPGAQMIDGAKGNSQYPALKTSEEIVQNADFHDFTIDYSSIGEPDPFYESDFSVDEDGWSAYAGTVVGNVDGIDGEDDVLKFYADSTDGSHYARRFNVITEAGQYYKITGKVYIPSTNTNLKSVRVMDTYAADGYVDITTQDSWVSFELEIHCSVDNIDLRFRGLDATPSYTWTGAGSSSDDIFYIKDIKVQRVGLVAWWQFDSYYNAQEGTGKTILQDLSGNGYDLTASTGFDWQNQLTGDDPVYKNGDALELDGVDDYLLLSNTYTNVYSPQDHSMTYLFYFNSGVLGYDKNVFSALGSPSYAGLYIKSDGTLHFNLKDDDSNGKYVSICSVNENKDYLVICSYDENNNKLDIYVNGNLKQSISTSYTTFTFGSEFDIGKSAFYANGYFDCFLYNTALFNRALSATEVQALYGKPKHWTWNETGSIANNNFKAELSGGAELSQDITTDDETLYKEQKISTTDNDVDYFGNTTSHTVTIDDGTWSYAGVKDVTNVDAVGSNFVEDFSKGGAVYFEMTDPVQVNNPSYLSMHYNVDNMESYDGGVKLTKGDVNKVGEAWKVFPTTIGTMYKISGYLKNVDADYVSFELRENTSPYTKLGQTEQINKSWEYFETCVIATQTEMRLEITVRSTDVADVVSGAYKDLKLEKISNGNHGLAQGGLETNQPVYPYAWEFDGVDDYVDFGSDLGNFGANPFILNVWIKINDNTGYSGILSKSLDTGDAYKGWQLYLDNTKVVFRKYQDYSSDAFRISTSPLPNGWHFISVVYNNKDDNFIYVDAELQTVTVEKNTLSDENVDNTANLTIGMSSFSSNYFSGQIAPVTIYPFDGQDGRASVMPSNYYQCYIQKIYNNTRRYFQ